MPMQCRAARARGGAREERRRVRGAVRVSVKLLSVVGLRRLREIISKGEGGPPNMTLTRRCMKSGRFIFLRSTRGKAHEVGGYLLGSSDLLRRFQIHHRHYRRFLFRCRSLSTSKAAVSAGRRNRERRDSATSTRRDVQDRIPEGDWHQLKLTGLDVIGQIKYGHIGRAIREPSRSRVGPCGIKSYLRSRRQRGRTLN